MNDFAHYHAEHIRLAVLKLLAGQPAYNANDSILTLAVNAIGLTCTRDQMRGHISWLAEQLLVTRMEAGGTPPIIVATLTERGGEVAAGRSFVQGVQRPGAKG